MIFGRPIALQATVRLDGDTYLVHMDPPPGPDACLWALQDNWRALFPGALPDEQRAFWDERLTDPASAIGYASLRPVAFDLARQLYGVPWWAAHRITEEAASAYLGYEGWCLIHGFDPAGQPARRIIASIVTWISSGWTDESDAKSWQQRCFMPPPGVRP